MGSFHNTYANWYGQEEFDRLVSEALPEPTEETLAEARAEMLERGGVTTDEILESMHDAEREWDDLPADGEGWNRPSTDFDESRSGPTPEEEAEMDAVMAAAASEFLSGMAEPIDPPADDDDDDSDLDFDGELPLVVDPSKEPTDTVPVDDPPGGSD